MSRIAPIAKKHQVRSRGPLFLSVPSWQVGHGWGLRVPGRAIDSRCRRGARARDSTSHATPTSLPGTRHQPQRRSCRSTSRSADAGRGAVAGAGCPGRVLSTRAKSGGRGARKGERNGFTSCPPTHPSSTRTARGRVGATGLARATHARVVPGRSRERPQWEAPSAPGHSRRAGGVAEAPFRRPASPKVSLSLSLLSFS